MIDSTSLSTPAFPSSILTTSSIDALSFTSLRQFSTTSLTFSYCDEGRSEFPNLYMTALKAKK